MAGSVRVPLRVGVLDRFTGAVLGLVGFLDVRTCPTAVTVVVASKCASAAAALPSAARASAKETTCGNGMSGVVLRRHWRGAVCGLDQTFGGSTKAADR